MHAFISTNELIRVCQTWHQTSLLEPEDRGKGAGEENTLNGSEGNKAFSESRTLVRDPSQSPVSLLLDARNSINSIEEVLALSRVFNVGINEKGVGFRVDVLHHNLEAVEASRFSSLNLVRKTFNQILVDDTVRGGEEGEERGGREGALATGGGEASPGGGGKAAEGKGGRGTETQGRGRSAGTRGRGREGAGTPGRGREGGD